MRFPKLLVPIAGVVLLASCRTAFDPAPAANHPRLSNIPRISPNPLPGVPGPETRRVPADEVPTLDLSGRAEGRNLILTARLDPSSRVGLEPYSQWSILLNIDTDQWRPFAHPGAEYMVTGSAGGWRLDVTDFTGRVTGSAWIEASPSSFVLRIPLAALGNDDGSTSCEMFLGSGTPHGLPMASYRFETRARPQGIMPE